MRFGKKWFPFSHHTLSHHPKGTLKNFRPQNISDPQNRLWYSWVIGESKDQNIKNKKRVGGVGQEIKRGQDGFCCTWSNIILAVSSSLMQEHLIDNLGLKKSRSDKS